MFKISSKGADLTNLKVSGAEIQSARPNGDTTVNDQGNTNLDNALRVLVVCGNDWVLRDKNGVISDSKGRSKNGSDTADLGKFGDGVTVTFTADAQNQ